MVVYWGKSLQAKMHWWTWKEDYASSREDLLKGLEGKRNVLHLGYITSGTITDENRVFSLSGITSV